MSTDFLKVEDKRWVSFHMSLTQKNLDLVWDLFHKDLTPEVPTDVKRIDFSVSTPLDISQLKDIRDQLDDDDFEDYERSRRKSERKELLAYCRHATTDDYAAWLSGWKNSAKATRSSCIKYSHNFKADNYFVLVAEPAYIPDLYGADSVNLIVPADINITTHDLQKDFHNANGHNDVFFMRNFQVVGSVNLYKDVN